MSTSPEFAESQNTYVIDAESASEMARLLDQDKLITEAMDGLFSERDDLSGIYDVVDIACGLGGWVHEVAHSYPEMEVTGIDISARMVEYARAHAKVRRLDNAHFRVMNVLKPLDFPDGSIDLVNARAIFTFMPPASWPMLIQEALRILRPGGFIRLTEVEMGFANTPAFERYCWTFNRALQLAGQSFSPNGLHPGITPMLGRFLRDAGCQHIKKKAHVIDFSTGEDAHGGFYQDLRLGFKLGQPFLVKTGVITQEEVDQLYQQALDEMQSEQFCALWYLLTVWGEKAK